MIFQRKHLDLIFAEKKTQTRREYRDKDKFGNPKPPIRYSIGHSYPLQNNRGKPTRFEGRIRITGHRVEVQLLDVVLFPLITPEDARAEGGYLPEEYEALYEQMHPGWMKRVVYTFVFEPSAEYLEQQRAEAEYDANQGIADAETEAKAEYEREMEIEYERRGDDQGPEDS